MTNPLLLNPEWEEADYDNGWSFEATIEIFSDEEQFKDYQNQDP